MIKCLQRNRAQPNKLYACESAFFPVLISFRLFGTFVNLTSYIRCNISKLIIRLRITDAHTPQHFFSFSRSVCSIDFQAKRNTDQWRIHCNRDKKEEEIHLGALHKNESHFQMSIDKLLMAIF